eukprot:6079288-Ditylum_brightwellii.AAC.1
MVPITQENSTQPEPDIEDEFVADEFVWVNNAQEPIKDADMNAATPKVDEDEKKRKAAKKDTTLPKQSKESVALITQEKTAAEVTMSAQIKQQ